jgi:hypothetical protein
MNDQEIRTAMEELRHRIELLERGGDLSVEPKPSGAGSQSCQVQRNRDVSADSSEGGLAEPSKGSVSKTASSGPSTRNLYMTPIPRSVVYSPPDGWIYWMSWGNIFAGDCRLEGAKLHLYPDGMIFFQATSITSSSGDVWLIKSIQFFDGFHNPVGQPLAQHNGMTMAWAGSEYPLVFWDAIPGVTPSGAATIRHATMTNHC